MGDDADRYADASMHFLIGARMQQQGTDDTATEKHLRAAAAIAAAHNLHQITARANSNLATCSPSRAD